MPGLGLGLGVQKLLNKLLAGLPKLGNLQLWGKFNQEDTLNAKMAAEFVSANNEYLSSASTDFDKTDSDFSFGFLRFKIQIGCAVVHIAEPGCGFAVKKNCLGKRGFTGPHVRDEAYVSQLFSFFFHIQTLSLVI